MFFVFVSSVALTSIAPAPSAVDQQTATVGTGAAAASAAAASGPAPIVVTGRELGDSPAAPAYDSVTINRDRLGQVASGRIEDALGDVAGFQLYRRSNSSIANPSAEGITVRALGGNAASRTLVLLDGVPLADPFFGSVPLTAISTDTLASARVTRGGGSGAFGAGALAGSIDLVSANADELGLVNAQALVNNRAETETTATIAPKLGDGFAVISGGWDRGRGFFTSPPDQIVAASARDRYASWQTSARAVTQIAPGVELQGRVAAFEDNQTLRFAGATTGNSGQDASLRVIGHGPWQFDLLGYLQLRDFHSVTISSTTYLPTLNQRATPTTGAGGKAEVRPPLGRDHLLRIGSDWRSAEGHTEESVYTKGKVSGYRRAGGVTSDVGFYGEDTWTTGPLVLTGGARADRWSVRSGVYQLWNAAYVPTTALAYPDRSGWTGSFRGGAVLHAMSGFDLRGSAYTGMRQPTLNELYRTYTVFPVTTLANPGLRNELLRGVEAGFDWHILAPLTLNATVFDNKVRNAIDNVSLTATTAQRENVAAINARGVELGATARAGTVSVGSSLAYTDAKVESPGQPDNGLRPAQTPRWTVSGNASWTPRPGTVISATLRHIGLAYEDDLSTEPLKPATTLGFYARTPVTRGISFVLRAENLTNETVVTRNSGGTIDLGTPRTVWAGIRVELR